MQFVCYGGVVLQTFHAAKKKCWTSIDPLIFDLGFHGVFVFITTPQNSWTLHGFDMLITAIEQTLQFLCFVQLIVYKFNTGKDFVQG